MFFAIAFLQIAVYLFVMPGITVALDPETPHGTAAFMLAAGFVAAFLVGHASVRIGRGFAPERSGLHEIKPLGGAMIVFWCCVHVVLCIRYGLYDRRVGTEVIAQVFAELSVPELFAIRALEVVLPYLLAIAFVSLWRRWSAANLLVLIALAASFAASGAMNSRSQAIVLGMSLLVMLQNVVGARYVRRITIAVVVAGAIVASLVTLSRVSGEDYVDTGLYVRDEVVKRLDGLEVTSMLIEMDGVRWTGTDPQSLVFAVVSAIPFLQQAADLKELALTTVKAHILDNEFSLHERDINSFVVTDAYYTGGVIGVILVGLCLGGFVRVIDRRIGATRSALLHLLLVSASCNAIVLEREAIGILLGTVRDWILLVMLTALVCRWRAVRSPSGPKPRRAPLGQGARLLPGDPAVPGGGDGHAGRGAESSRALAS